METQSELLFVDGPTPHLHLPDPNAAFFGEIAEVWGLPVGQNAHVSLREHSFSELQGRLELARAPDLPLNRRESLTLRVGPIEFSSQQVIAWALV